MGLPVQDEQAFTPHAEAGWLAWDSYSPEQDFCRFAGMLQRMLRPAVVLETGVGVGRLTEHLNLGACTYLGFEADPKWRRPPADPVQGTPTAGHMAAADLVILDSAPEYRFRELARWVERGKPGSVCLVHDCGNGHAEDTFHHKMRRAVEAAGLPGVFLRNPRGGWLGIHA
ncbi:hypothetical protein [Streptomyces echinoruber]|uniref:hypothetical protein n=1 Tax=Streptomyces echinoruber TaxID=68898 RepID=UPI00167D2927|nr:hypothetical protein [Streptomyces echinoruber]